MPDVAGDVLIDWLEDTWLKPCIERTPHPFQGFCLYAPMFVVGFTLIMSVVLMAWC